MATEIHGRGCLGANPRIWSLAAVAGLIVAGCGEAPTDYSELGLVDVTGKVTMDGSPLAGVTVRFEGPPLRVAQGLTDAEGRYRLMYDSDQPGCLPGEKVVRIVPGSVGEGGEEGGAVEGPDGRVAPVPASIPSEYNRSSKLAANVSASTKSFDFDLKSKP